MEVKTIFVIGAGQMGSGIAHVFAVGGYNVYLHDLKEEFVDRGMANIRKNLGRLVEKGKMEQSAMDTALNNIQSSTDIQNAKNADLIIEAAIENMDIKSRIFKELDGIIKEGTIVATNTSSLPITEIAAVMSHPENFIGMHFFNPVPVMKLVEVIKGLATSAEVFQTVKALAENIGKVPVEVEDFPGFVGNRILLPMINEAVYTLHEGVASIEDIDAVMRLGMNHPMGPLQLADFIGLDTCLSIMETLHEGLGDSKYRPCPLLRKYVKAGWLGKKTGRGFYTYDK